MEKRMKNINWMPEYNLISTIIMVCSVTAWIYSWETTEKHQAADCNHVAFELFLFK